MPSDHEGEVEAVAAELSRLVERLDDLALRVLREAAEEGARSRPALERRLTRARNALERCRAGLLAGAEPGADDVP